jgi:hypothetical protein
MNGTRIGQFTFLIDNGGLLITITKEDKEDTERFDPEESIKLLKFLSQHEGTFNAAIKPSEPPFGSKEWQNDYLERKFSEMES